MVVAANEVSHHAARFTNQQFATGEIPRLQADFEETVNAASGHVSQIQRSRTGTTEICTFVKQLAQHIDVAVSVLLGFEREAGSQNSAIEIFCIGTAQAITVELCALTARGGEQFVTHWVVNYRDFSAAFNAHGDRNSKVRETFYEVGGAIQWVDNPLYFLVFASQFTTFFTNNGVFWV